jgi:hypothetical protein
MYVCKYLFIYLIFYLFILFVITGLINSEFIIKYIILKYIDVAVDSSAMGL